jgi:hypothetical protein
MPSCSSFFNSCNLWPSSYLRTPRLSHEPTTHFRRAASPVILHITHRLCLHKIPIHLDTSRSLSLAASLALHFLLMLITLQFTWYLQYLKRIVAIFSHLPTPARVRGWSHNFINAADLPYYILCLLLSTLIFQPPMSWLFFNRIYLFSHKSRYHHYTSARLKTRQAHHRVAFLRRHT